MPLRESVTAGVRVAQGLFPIRVDASKRCVVSADGTPIPLFVDSPSSMEVQLTRPQIDTYLDDRIARGITAILIEAFEAKFSSQTPAYQNANGDNPFTTMTDFSTPNEAYWAHVDYIVNACKKRRLIVFIAIAYLGFGGGNEGWNSTITSDTAAHLKALGSFYALRYQQGNVIWVPLGDYSGTQTERDKQWNIVLGMKQARPNEKPLLSGWPARADGEGYPQLSGYSEYIDNGLNSIYCATTGVDAYSLAATAYARGLAFWQIESGVENSNTLAELRRSWYGAMLSGACGCLFQNIPLWGFGEPNSNGGLGAASALSTSLNSTGVQQFTFLRNLIVAYSWWLGVPKTDSSLVSPTSLGTGTGRVVPMLSSDGTWAMIFTPTVNVTVVMTNFTKASVRGRWYDPTAGSFADASGTPFANTGSQSFTAPGERVLVLD